MKFKAAVTSNAPKSLIERFDSPAFGLRLMQEVVCQHLHVEMQDMGPATHYVQYTDPLIPVFGNDIGVVVGFTMLSCARTRSAQDFENAMWEIERIYEQAIRQTVPGGMKAQLFVALSLDDKIEPPSHMGTKPLNLIETPPKWIEGKGGQPLNIWFVTNPVR